MYGPADALVRGALGAVPPDRLGAPLTAAAFSSVLGPWGGAVVSLSLLLFAFSSILGWSWYGEQSILYLTGSRRLVPAYRLVFLSCVVLGSVWEGEAVWELVDLCNALMAIPQSDGPPAPLPPGAAGAAGLGADRRIKDRGRGSFRGPVKGEDHFETSSGQTSS